MTTKRSVRIAKTSVGNIAKHHTELLGLNPLNLSLRSELENVPAELFGMMTNAGKRQCELKRLTTSTFTPTARGLASPTVRDFRGPAKKLQKLFSLLDGASIGVAVMVRADNVVKCHADLSRIGNAEGIRVTQQADGTFRAASECSCYHDVQRLLIIAQAMAAITDEACGYPTEYDVAAACEGYGVHRNYSVKRAKLDPISYRF